MALSFAFDTSKGETPETVAQRRQMSNLIAARMLGTAPKNVGEGLNAIGQALIARSMMGDADAAQKAGEASLPDFIKAQITGQPATTTVATPPAVAAAPMGGTSIPVSQADTGPVVPNDANAMPKTAGMNLALADRSQDFIQDNPNTYLSSGVRSTADQQRLYDNRANNPNPVARPGTSNHERGMAIDIGGMTPGQRAMLPQYGLAQPVANDPPHVELAKATDAPSPLDTAQYPFGPMGAPGTQVAQATPQSANDGAELPPNAQPTQGPLPTAQAVQQASQPRSQSYGGPFANVSTQDLTKAAFNPWLKASNPAAAQAITAEITRRATMDQQASDPMRALDMQTKQLAIRKAQQDLDKPSDNKQVVKIGQDSLGREQYGIFDKSNGTIKPYTPPNNGQPDPLGNTNLSGKDYLATLPKEQANTVQLMVEGRIPPPTSFAMSKPYWQNMIAAAKNYDPTFDATAWAGRVAGTRDFSSGKSAEMVRSANQTLHHVGQLLDSMDKLNNGSYPMLNSVGNYIAEARGSGAQGSFRTNAHAVAEELSKVFKGSNLSDAEIHAWEKNLHENMSPEQQRMQIAKLRDLLQGSLHALDEKRTASIGPMASEKAGPIIKEEGERVLQRIDSWVKGTPDKTMPETSQRKTSSGVSWSIQ